MALWDIKGKALGTPVWNLLGGQVRDRIRIYSHASAPDVALELKQRGITAVKTGGVRDPLHKVAAIREAVGDDVDIMVDLHGPPWMTPKDAIVLGRALEPYHLLFLEDPVAPENIELLARVRVVAIPDRGRRTAGNHLGLARDDRTRDRRRDPARYGPRRRHQPDEEAGRHGRGASHHDGAALGRAGPGRRIRGPAPPGRHTQYTDAGAHRERLAGPQSVISAAPVLENGHLLVPTAPGLGVDIDEAAIARHPMNATSP